MSRLHRAVEKAQREGLLTWTRPLEGQSRQAATLDEPGETGGQESPVSASTALTDAQEPATPASMRHARDAAPSELRNQAGADRPGRFEAQAATPGPAAPPAWFNPIDLEDEVDLRDAAFSPLFVAATEPGSAAAEQYRLLRTRLEARDATRRTQLLVVTSPRLGDGKTTTSANLALTMAREFQHRVVLVEADLRRPSLAARFGMQAERGLVDVLMGALALEDALVTVPGHQLTLLPAGAEAARSTELLASSMMQQVLEELRARFDRIVVDTPPVALADTHVLARLADGVMVVVRAGVTPRPALERALASIDRERLLGIVLNEVDDGPGEYAYPGLEYSGGRRE